MARIYSLEGNTQKLDGGAMFGNCPRALWEKWLKPDERGASRFGLSINAYRR